MKFSWNATSGFAYEGELPGDDVIAAVLHRARPFLLQKERNNFLAAHAVLAKYVRHAEFRVILKAQRDSFLGKGFQRQLKITASTPTGRKDINSEAVFGEWLNGFEYHRDANKRKAVEGVSGILTTDGVRGLCVSMLLDKLRAIFNLAIIIRRCEARNGVPLSVER